MAHGANVGEKCASNIVMITVKMFWTPTDRKIQGAFTSLLNSTDGSWASMPSLGVVWLLLLFM